MIGTILVEGFEIECIVGILPHERENPQVIMVDIELDRDFAAAAASDDVKDTVDYVAVAELVRDLAVDNQYWLIEKMAEEAAAAILKRFGGERVMVKIMKPEAVAQASWTAVRVERRP